MNIDFGEVPDIEDLRSVPPGEYPCRISEVRVTQSPAGHTRWGMRWEAVGTEYQGRTVGWDSLHWTERGLPRAKFVLGVLGFPTEGEIELESSELEGREAWVTVEPDERVDPVTGIRRLTNRVPYSGYRALTGREAAGSKVAEAGSD